MGTLKFFLKAILCIAITVTVCMSGFAQVENLAIDATMKPNRVKYKVTNLVDDNVTFGYEIYGLDIEAESLTTTYALMKSESVRLAIQEIVEEEEVKDAVRKLAQNESLQVLLFEVLDNEALKQAFFELVQQDNLLRAFFELVQQDNLLRAFFELVQQDNLLRVIAEVLEDEKLSHLVYESIYVGDKAAWSELLKDERAKYVFCEVVQQDILLEAYFELVQQDNLLRAFFELVQQDNLLRGFFELVQQDNLLRAFFELVQQDNLLRAFFELVQQDNLLRAFSELVQQDNLLRAFFELVQQDNLLRAFFELVKEDAIIELMTSMGDMVNPMEVLQQILLDGEALISVNNLLAANQDVISFIQALIPFTKHLLLEGNATLGELAFVNIKTRFHPQAYNLIFLKINEYNKEMTMSKTDNVITSMYPLEKQNLLVYPNPTSGSFTIERPGEDDGEYWVTVYDTVGKQVYKEKMDRGMYKVELDLTGFTSGVYLISLDGEKIQFNQKLMVK